VNRLRKHRFRIWFPFFIWFSSVFLFHFSRPEKRSIELFAFERAPTGKRVCPSADKKKYRDIWYNLTIRGHVVETLVAVLLPVHAGEEEGQQRDEENGRGHADVEGYVVFRVLEVRWNNRL
jgi:hypothetical protein